MTVSVVSWWGERPGFRWLAGGGSVDESWPRLCICQGGPCDSGQATPFVLAKKQRPRLGFSGLGGRCQVTGSLRVTRDRERREAG